MLNRSSLGINNFSIGGFVNSPVVVSPPVKVNAPIIATKPVIKPIIATKPVIKPIIPIIPIVSPPVKVNEQIEPSGSGYQPYVDENGQTPIDHPSNWGQTIPVLQFDNNPVKVIPIIPIVSPPVKVGIDPLTQEYQSTDVGITVNGIWYPDQPPIGYNEQPINPKHMIPQIIDSAPPQEIYGRVIDENQQPIPFVEVYTEQRTTNGTTTDNNGNYRLMVLGFENVVFSYAGYSQSFSAMGVPRILQLKANDLSTVDLGNLPIINTPSTASFGKVAALLLGGLFLGSLFKSSENKPTAKPKPTGLNKPRIRKKTKTITL